MIIYPIFEECSEYTFDTRITGLLKMCAHGTFPNGYSFDGQKISNIITGDVLPVDKSVEELFVLLVDFFDLNTVSKNNSESSTANGVATAVAIVTPEWKKLRKDIKEKLLNNYIHRTTIKYSLNKMEINELESVLSLSLQFQSISTSDIVIENDEIKSINKITFDEKNRVWSYPIIKKTEENKKQIKSTLNVVSYFDKYIKYYLSRAIVC